MTRRAIRQERRAQEEAKWQGFESDWRDQRDTEDDELPERDDEPVPSNTLQ
ncbi:hypothetical protein [Acidovorax sp. LjRoot117]|uniref:hypothetical protein n=1 Tax=Acidovorax sp. LjRoot117 TaxID=3342255 RepID=UPI003ECCBE4E